MLQRPQSEHAFPHFRSFIVCVCDDAAPGSCRIVRDAEQSVKSKRGSGGGELEWSFWTREHVPLSRHRDRLFPHITFALWRLPYFCNMRARA